MHPSVGDIETFWTNASDVDAVEVVVIVPTFKRPNHLRTTLRSVLAQNTGPNFAVVVMDNHPQGSEGAKAARELLSGVDRPSIIVLAHRRGNCAAYNAGFWTALENYPSANYVQIIDDDEIARPDWLDQMVRVAKETGADMVGAPQWPAFEGAGLDVWKRHPVFTPPYLDEGEVPILYSSGNVLIRTELLRRHGHPWFDEAFNFLGGGDSDFYSRNANDGARFAWAPEAGVIETTPARRTEPSWLNARSLRNGSISAAIQRKAARSTGDHAARWTKTLLLIAASPYRSLIRLAQTRSPTMALDPMNVAIGRLLMEFGFANEQYRAADKN